MVITVKALFAVRRCGEQMDWSQKLYHSFFRWWRRAERLASRNASGL